MVRPRRSGRMAAGAGRRFTGGGRSPRPAPGPHPGSPGPGPGSRPDPRPAPPPVEGDGLSWSFALDADAVFAALGRPAPQWEDIDQDEDLADELAARDRADAPA